MEQQPLVTAMCLTRDRREWLPKAIEYFQAQTYPRLEMLILNDGVDVADLIPNDDRIRLHTCEKMTIGLKRNRACQLARGEVICHFDDDDYFAPTRIEDQIQRMQEADKAVTGYCTVIFEGLFEKEQGRYKYVGIPNVTAVGTSLVYKKSWWAEHQFPDKHVGEDGDFAMAAAQQKQLISCDAGELIIASSHPGNTSRRHVQGQQWVKL